MASSQSSKRIKLEVMEHEASTETTGHPGMTCSDEMNAFYNHSYGLNAETELNEQAAQWSETFPSSSKPRTKCEMCGNEDHLVTSCPNSCCLKCGEKTITFQKECPECVEWASVICKICGEQGHSKNDCPDHWRCYHSTIDTKSSVEYSVIDDPKNITFDWDSNGNSSYGQFYQRFLNATNGQTRII